MIVCLRDLAPNPFRDFQIDPIDPTTVEALRISIREDGFWGGVVCRRSGKEIQIAAGHHRVEAAILERIKTADLFVAERIEDEAMLRIYARENATQRGLASSTARAGSVAGAIRLGLIAFTTWDVSMIIETWPEFTLKSVEVIRGQIAGQKGLGAEALAVMLRGVSGITTRTIQDDLASLKRSGHYTRLVAEAETKAGAERQRLETPVNGDRPPARIKAPPLAGVRGGAVVTAERVRDAEIRLARGAEKAEAQEITFDFTGVARHLKVADHLRAFRDKVNAPGVRAFVPVENQAELAARLVAYAAETGQELSGYFIRSCLMSLVAQLAGTRNPLSVEEKREIAGADWEERYRDLRNWFITQLRSATIHGQRLVELLDQAPPGFVATRSDSSRQTLELAKQLIAQLEEKV